MRLQAFLLSTPKFTYQLPCVQRKLYSYWKCWSVLEILALGYRKGQDLFRKAYVYKWQLFPGYTLEKRKQWSPHSFILYTLRFGQSSYHAAHIRDHWWWEVLSFFAVPVISPDDAMLRLWHTHIDCRFSLVGFSHTCQFLPLWPQSTWQP